MRVKTSIAATLAAVMALGSLGIDYASAAPAAPLQKAVQLSGDNADVIHVASKKRRHRGNNAAAAAAFAGIAGAVIGLAAQDSYRRRYYDEPSYYYDGGYRGRTYYRGGGYRSYPGHPPGYSGPPLGNPALGQVTTPAQPDSLR